MTQQLLDRMAMIELAVNGRLINLPANTLLGRLVTSGTVEPIPAASFATPTQLAQAIDQAILDLAGGAPGALNTLKELAGALNNDANFAANVTNTLATKVDVSNAQTIDGNKIFLKPIKVPFLEKDIVIKITTGINWISNNWYAIPGLSIPFAFGEVRAHELTVNYQYNDGAATYNHFQMGGSCRLPGGVGWKAGGSRSEVTMILQCHNANDNVMTFRSAIGGQSRGLEVKSNFDISLSGLGFIEFAIKRL